MSIMGLHLGVSFAEISLLKADTLEPIAHQRIYLPRLPLKSALQKFILKHSSTNIKKIFIASNHVEKLAPFRLGGSTAHLVTEGFENTGWLSQVCENTCPPTRWPSVQSQELIFGIKERVSASGEILEPLDLEFISQIVSKLKLMEVKRVCIHFLHSQKNPAHLQQAGEIIRSQGFEVYDTRYDSDLDIEKSRRLSLTSAVAGTWEDIKLELQQAFPSTEETPAIFVLNSHGYKELSQATDSLENLSGLDYLWGYFQNNNIIHLGLENFSRILPKQKTNTWESPWGKVYRPHSKKNFLEAQPTSPLKVNFWDEIDFDLSTEGFEPGPMSLGRGQKLTAFDLFFDELIQKPELTDWMSPGASTKISSNLTALTKHSKGGNSPSAISENLKSQFKNRILHEALAEPEPLFVGFWTQVFNDLPGTSKLKVSEAIARVGMGASL